MNPERIKILIVDDEESVRESLSAWLERDGYTVDTAPDGPCALEKVRQAPWNILLVDLKMPGMDGLQVLAEVKALQPELPVLMMTAYATVDTAVQAIKGGAYDYLVKPFDAEELSLAVERIAQQAQLRHENDVLRKALKRELRFHDLYSKSPAMRACFDLARAAARSNSTILVLGESGTGKEVFARAIHAESTRAHGPFVAVSCAALTETLLESELFGHERGSFTGANARRKGKFEAAAGGTLFLDEIGDVSPKLQLDLLRVLEDRQFFRVGGTEAVKADVRIIAATNRDLNKAVAGGHFREDLFYRLNVIPVRLPPLRDRLEDLPLLVENLLDRLSVELGKPLKGVTGDAMALMLAHAWPGNIRELRNVLERGAVIATSPIIGVAELGLAAPPQAAPHLVLSSLDEVEKRHIGFVLDQFEGKVAPAARVLGIDRATLYNKIKKYGLRRGDADGIEDELAV